MKCNGRPRAAVAIIPPQSRASLRCDHKIIHSVLYDESLSRVGFRVRRETGGLLERYAEQGVTEILHGTKMKIFIKY